MSKRLSQAAALCLALFLLPGLSRASDSGEEAGFVNPTRSPNAPEYSTEHPEELVPDQLVARSFILTEANSGIVLFDREPDLRLFPASTTKVMTALIALETLDLNDTLTVSAGAVNIPEDSSRVPFREGEELTVRDALYGLLLHSGNDAANALAEKAAGDIDTFVTWMNETAAVLGCTNTHFVNPHGYHDEFHQTTARDLATIMRAALQNETFRQIIGTRSYNLSATNKNPARNIRNSNLHIDPESNYFFPSSIGGKTGFTSDAGYVLVEAAHRDGAELIAVAMYSGIYSRWPDTSRLFAYGFTQYRSVTAEELYARNPATLQVNGFSPDDAALGHLGLQIRPRDPARTVRFTDHTSVIDHIIGNYSEYTNIRYDIEPRAPIAQGQAVGVLTFFPPGEDPAEYELIATRSIAARQDAPPTLEEIEQRVRDDPSPFPPLDWDWILPPVLGVGTVCLGLWALIRFMWRHRRSGRRLPKPKSRSYI